CHHRFEKIQKFSDPHVKKCPRCGGAVEQLLSPPAVQFKGSGWYVTDYAKKSGATSQQSSNGGASDKGEKVEKKEKQNTSRSTRKAKRNTEEEYSRLSQVHSSPIPTSNGSPRETFRRTLHPCIVCS